MKELYNLKDDNNSPAIESINNKFEKMKEYSSKKFLSSLLLIGEFKSGKSSFINSLIGLNLNLLEVKSTECTKVAIIVRYTEKKENITLYSAILKEDKGYGLHFIEDKLEAKGMINVKNKIVELNEISELKYYILYTPIQAYDDLNFEKELKNKIELIDFPGLAFSSYNDKVEKEIKKLIKKESAFIFVKNGKEFHENKSAKIIELIFGIIRQKYFFDINNCLFLFTFPKDNDNYNTEKIKKNLFQIFDKQTINKCMIKRKFDKNFINENKLIISKLDSPLYEDYLKFNELVDNFTLFTEKIIFDYKKKKINNKFYNYFNYFLTRGNYTNFKYSTLKIRDNKDKEKYGYILDDILKNYSIELKEKDKYLEYYLKIKENKKLYLSFNNSYYEETIQQLKKIITNIEIKLNETLNEQIFKFSKEILGLFNYIENNVLKKKLSITEEETETIKEKINEIISKLKNMYNTEKIKIIKEFNMTDSKISKFNLNEFNYDKSNEIFENSIDEMITKYNELIEELNTHINDHIEYFQNNSKNELNNLKNDKTFKNYFKDFSKEYIHIIQLIEKKQSLSIKNKETYQKYNEYDYYKTDEYKKSSSGWKFFYYPKGIYKNIKHDYIEDKKKHSQKILEEFKSDFKEKNLSVISKIKNIYDNTNNELNNYRDLFNSKWENIIKDKKRYLDLSKKIMNFINQELYK